MYVKVCCTSSSLFLFCNVTLNVEVLGGNERRNSNTQAHLHLALMYKEGGEWEQEGGGGRREEDLFTLHDIKTPALRVLKQNQKPHP